ncbi:MAG: lipocalin-like domain-containing protein [Acidobacteria bacterium]|nr:lipocalin-like domain-containing protein [Acidobacteriota bacterium]
MRMHKALGVLTAAVLLGALAAPAQAQAPPKPGPTPGAAKMIVGTWRMVGAQTQAVDGSGEITYPRGVRPTGYIIYDAGGMMYVQIMNSDEVRPPKTGTGQMSMEDQAKAFSSYTAYFGRYSIDEEEGSVTHDPQANTNPRQVGDVRKRFLEITNDTLELNTFNTGADGVERITRRMWERPN